ncbi:MAG: TldE/PmbA family protein [Planctomycetes bacterium]|nr:TldE/PmbA family protein [Planctomycetota bacterium]
MQQHFYELADYLTGQLRGDEIYLASFSGEESDFVRFNNSAIRQAGSVVQADVTLDLIRGSRHAEASTTLSGDAATDRHRLDSALTDLRARLEHVSDDPHLLYATEINNTEQRGDDRLPDREAAVSAILEAGKGRDLVGIYAQGGIFNAFANSLGQRNWFSTYTFHVDWCFYHSKDKAVKSSYADFEWDDDKFERRVAGAVEQLSILAGTPKTIEPGCYRVYLAPAAVSELLETLAWGGFGLKAHRTKNTSLLKMVEGDARLHPSVTIAENTRDGLAPNFQSAGFVRPDRVILIQNGEYANCLVSSRSAKEYGAKPNGADEGEYPESLDMAAGDLPADEILEQLGTGVFINQLWYLNYSDRPACRITGMTRFATFWVENGRIAAPLNVMRFDETIYRVLGENLIGLTREREFIPSAETYGARSTESCRGPGALVGEFEFTL